jgi:hypothetical protein
MAFFDVPQRFSRKWVEDKVPHMDSTELHAMFHEAATRGWTDDEPRQIARMWSEDSGDGLAKPSGQQCLYPCRRSRVELDCQIKPRSGERGMADMTIAMFIRAVQRHLGGLSTDV